jgi:hypothetical protein
MLGSNARGSGSGSSEPDGRLARWLRWVEQYADRTDPLKQVESLPLDPEGYGRRPLDLEAFAIGDPSL